MKEGGSDTMNPKGFSLTGRDPVLWKKLRSRFMDLCEKVMDLQLDDRSNNTIRDEINEFKGLALDHGKAKLERPVLENVEIKARVEKLYAEKVKILTEARKCAAEARIAEVEAEMKEYLWKINQTRYQLLGLKALMVGERNDEMIVYSDSIDGLLDMLSAIKRDVEGSLQD